MSTPREILELIHSDDTGGGAQEAARATEHAAALVDEFAQQCSTTALSAVLAIAGSSESDALDALGRIARDTTEQCRVLQKEVKRFLSCVPQD